MNRRIGELNSHLGIESIVNHVDEGLFLLYITIQYFLVFSLKLFAKLIQYSIQYSISFHCTTGRVSERILSQITGLCFHLVTSHISKLWPRFFFQIIQIFQAIVDKICATVRLIQNKCSFEL